MAKVKTFYTDYKTAAQWCNCALVLCNNIETIDSSIYDNMRFDYYDKNGEPTEIYQWYITDLSAWTVEFQEQAFNLKYTYSDLLDCYILCVDHFGTGWDYVPCEVKSKDWIEVNKDKEYNKG